MCDKKPKKKARKNYKCQICPSKFDFKYQLRKHNVELHFRKSSKCLMCNTILVTKHNMIKHVKAFHVEKEHISFKWKDNLKTYVKPYETSDKPMAGMF